MSTADDRTRAHALVDGELELVEITRADVRRMAELVRRYADFPLGMVDAAVITLAELRHNLSAYDAAYVALAEALECPLLTRDARISRHPTGPVQPDVHC